MRRFGEQSDKRVPDSVWQVPSSTMIPSATQSRSGDVSSRGHTNPNTRATDWFLSPHHLKRKQFTGNTLRDTSFDPHS